MRRVVFDPGPRDVPWTLGDLFCAHVETGCGIDVAARAMRFRVIDRATYRALAAQGALVSLPMAGIVTSDLGRFAVAREAARAEGAEVIELAAVRRRRAGPVPGAEAGRAREAAGLDGDGD